MPYLKYERVISFYSYNVNRVIILAILILL